MVLKGVLFDLDGTLIDFKINFGKSRQTTIDILEGAGFPKNRLTPEMLIIPMIELAGEYFRNELKMSTAEIEAIKEKINKHIEGVEREASFHATIRKGMKEVLDFLVENRVKMGIITFNTSPNAHLSIEYSGLASYFPDLSVVVGRDMIKRAKPHPDHAIVILDKFGLKPDEICIVGDHPKDIETAVNLSPHTNSIGILRGKHVAEEFQTPHVLSAEEIPDKMIALFQDMLIS